MYCTKCGAQLPDGVIYCTYCGGPVEKEMQQPTPSDPYEPTMQMHYGAASQQPVSQSQQGYQEHAQGHQQNHQQGGPYAPVFVEEPRHPDSSGTDRGGKNTAIIVALVAVIIVLLVGIGAYFVASGKNTATTNTNNNVAETSANTNTTTSTNTNSSTNSSSNSNTNTSANTSAATNTSASSDAPHATSDTPSTSSTSSTSSTTNIGPSPSSSSAVGTTVNLVAITAGGNTISGVVHRDANDYVIADSSTRAYSKSELRALGLTDAELCIAWNEPFAREGYHFKNSSLQNYFNSCSWYTDRGKQFSLTGVAATNNTLLREIADENSSSKQWESLATN